MMCKTWRALGALMLAMSLVVGGSALAQAAATKHVILLVADGSQLAHEVAASRYLHGTDYGLSFHDMPQMAYVTTWDVDTYNYYADDEALGGGVDDYSESDFWPFAGYADYLKNVPSLPYPLSQDNAGTEAYFLRKRNGRNTTATDSGSSATALATGKKTDAGNIAWKFGDPENGSIETIAEKVRRELGGAFGTTTTVPFNHATPASFIAHNIYRSNYSPEKKRSSFTGATLAEEIVQTTQPDVVIGAGHPDYAKGYITDDLMSEIKANNDYIVVERSSGVNGGAALLSAAQQAASSGKKLFGLFGGTGGHFESPVPRNQPGNPQIDLATTENPTYGQTITAALTVLAQNPNAFFLMAEQGDVDWANHQNDFQRMIGTMWDFDEGVKAAIAFVNLEGDNITWDNTLLIVTADHANSYMRFHQNLGAGVLPAQQVVGINMYGQDLFALINGEYTYRSDYHTNELVTLYARGAGSELFNKYKGAWNRGNQIIDNTHIFQVMREALGVSDN